MPSGRLVSSSGSQGHSDCRGNIVYRGERVGARERRGAERNEAERRSRAARLLAGSAAGGRQWGGGERLGLVVCHEQVVFLDGEGKVERRGCRAPTWPRQSPRRAGGSPDRGRSTTRTPDLQPRVGWKRCTCGSTPSRVNDVLAVSCLSNEVVRGTPARPRGQ